MVSGNTESGITVTYDDAGTGTGKLNFSVGTLNQNTSDCYCNSIRNSEKYRVVYH